MDYEEIRAEYTAIDAQIGKLQRMIKKIPGGDILCTNSGKYSKWYERTEEGLAYLGKGNREYAEKLAQKKLYSTKLKSLEQERYVRGWFLKHYDVKLAAAADALFASPAYSELITAGMKPKQIRIREWLDSPYEKCREHKEKLIHNAPPGIMVRSKSEVMIASAINSHGIPFRYECILNLGDMYYFPDFTIFHPKTGKLIYWEHFGMMDDPQYIHKTSEKLEIYALHDIVPSVNLITTFETSKHPLTTDIVENMIRQFFK